MSSSNSSSAQSSLFHVFSIFAFYGFAVFNYLLYFGLALKSGQFFKKPSEQAQLRLAISRDRFWNLSKQPIKGFEHAFFKLRNGFKLHYITNRKSTSQPTKKGGNLVIFLHGFPDTCMVWRHVLQEPGFPFDSARVVCLDLPGYGGSDHFKLADTAVLEAVAEFIVAVKEQHEQATIPENKDFNTILVAHDWGGVVGFRLAAEAPALVDRFIISNGPHMGLVISNKDRIINSSAKIFKQFQESPQKNFSCLGKSIKAVRPLLFQAFLSGYIFAFHLPRLMVTYLGSGGNCAFLLGAAKSAHGRNQDGWNAQEALATVQGPGVIEVDTNTAEGESYGSTVHDRAGSIGESFWYQTSYYRDDLAFQKWDKSLELIADLYNIESESSASASVSPIRRRSSSSASSTLFTEQYLGALRAPSTIVWGEQDLALTKGLCVDGIGDYLARGSEVILLPRTGHWVPVEKEGRVALVKVISLCAAATADNLPVYMAKDVGEVYPGATSIVRK